MASQAAVGSASILGPSTRVANSQEKTGRWAWRRGIGSVFTSLPLGSWALFDLTLLYLGIYLGFRLFVFDRHLPYAHVLFWQGWISLAITFVFAGLVFGLYERETLFSRSRIMTRMMLTTITAVVITYAIIYVLMYTHLSRRVTGSAIGLCAVFGGSARLIACWALHRVPRALAIVGPGIVSNSLVRAFRQGFLHEYRLVGYVGDKPVSSQDLGETRWLGKPTDLNKIREIHGIQDIVVGAEAAADLNVMKTILPCLRRGCRVTNEATFYEKATGQILVDEINPHWFLFADLQVHCQRRQALKRAFDVVGAAIGIIITLPLLPIIAALIKLGDGGPVFYTQMRVGRNGRNFKLYKFRTMKVDAEPSKPVWAVKNDARITRVGRFLRQTRLDELPQLYNILADHMSVVGPRPERPELVVELTEHIPYYNERHLIKPGLTGWAQIGFRYGSSIEDAKRKLQFDLYYLKHLSMELDMMILLRTFGVFLRGAC